MLIAFMAHLELCFEIKDKQVLDYIHKVEPNLTDTRYIPLFSRAHQDRNSQACVEKDTSMSYHIGWILQTSQDTDFFNPCCLQVLILRIVFTFRLTPALRVQRPFPAEILLDVEEWDLHAGAMMMGSPHTSSFVTTNSSLLNTI